MHFEEDKVSKLEMNGQVLSVLVDPKEEFFAVSVSDGKIYLFHLPIESGASPFYSTRLCSRIADIE